VALRVAPKAEKDLRRIGPGPSLDRIEEKLLELDAVDDFNAPESIPNTKRLRGTDVPIWRTRVGDYRVIWTLASDGPVVVRVVQRSDLDQAIDRL